MRRPIPRAARGLTGLLLAALLAWNVPASSRPGDESQPIQIEADAVELDDGKSESVYTGNVEVRQGTMRLWADRVTVRHRESRATDRIVAVGKPARFTQEPDGGKQEVKARALRIEYDAGSDELVLIDQAEVLQGKDSFRSDRILYDRKNAVVKGGAAAKGKERVRITITPDAK